MSPKLTVILPTFNSALYVNETINSILAQSYANFKFVIIDDGSTDGTIPIIRSYNDPRITLILSDHIGKPGALNKALEYVTTPYIAFIDHDDISLPKRFSLQLEFMESHADVGIISAWYYICNENGQIIRERKLPTDHNAIEQEMTIHCSMIFPCLMMRSELIRRFVRFNENNFSGTDDLELFYNLLPHVKFRNIPIFLLKHRRHTSSFSYKKLKEQNLSALQLTKDYLLKRMNDKYVNTGMLNFRIGVAEYYKGSMKEARKYFLKALRNGFFHISLFRYFVPSFLGDTIFKNYRDIINIKRYSF